MAVKFFNTKTQKKDEYIAPHKSGVYTCGPTVYNDVTIGNWRTYVLGDIVVRTLEEDDINVKYVMNITDVGHLTGDNSGDADTGEDRMEKAKKAEGLNAWKVAEKYTERFLFGFEKLNLIKPEIFAKATDHIKEQIDLVQKLEDSGLSYKTSDGIYFDTLSYEEKGFKYGELSNLDEIREGARVEINTEKKNPRDFALWKFSDEKGVRDMEWESPWGLGFPGWHIECSAMSMKYLGEQFDIHIGGEDLKSTHHPNEIAQSQGATGHSPFVKTWIHGAFLQVDGGRMGKSLGNAYTIYDLIEKNIDPLALKMFFYGANYRTPLNFTWEGLEASEKSLNRIRIAYFNHFWKERGEIGTANPETMADFKASINDDLNLPKAISIFISVIHEKLEPKDRIATILEMDKYLGLGFEKITMLPSEEVENIIEERKNVRDQKDFAKSDELRDKILELGFVVEDKPEGIILIPKEFSNR